MAAPSGIPFGNYQLLKRIARGGMAEVFLGRQKGPEGFDRLVAVKRVLPHLVDSENFVRMFFDEARLAANLSHPNCVHIYEFGKVDDHYFIAMEYVDGINAGDLIKWGSKEALPPVLVARIGADACAGLHYAHELRDVSGRLLHLVHRDVSPPNLLVSHDGTVKLVDFGIAKAVISVEQTRPGVVKGKYAYMSPEQTTGQQLDGRSDVFSLALVLWELLAGRVAVTREDQVAAMKSIRDGKLTPLEEVRPDVPPALARALARGLEVKPSKRVSALELGLELEEFIKGSPELGSSLHLAQWLRTRFPRQHPTGELQSIDDGPPGTRQATSATRGAAGMTRGQEGVAVGKPRDPDIDGPSVMVSESLAELDSAETQIAEPHAKDEILATFARPDAAPPDAIAMPEPPPGEASLTQLAASVPPAAPRPSGERARRIAIAAGASLALGAAILLAVSAGDGTSQGGAASADMTEPAAAAEIEPAAPADAAGVQVSAVEPADAGAGAGASEAGNGDKAQKGLGIIEIITQPQGAKVTLDEGIPTESPVLFAEVDPGVHDVAIALKGYESVHRRLKVTAGQRRTLDLRLEEKEEPPPKKPPVETHHHNHHPPRKRYGILKVRTRPYSVVYYHGHKLGTTPFANVKLKPGRYTLTFKNPSHRTQRRRVRIRAGKETKLEFTLK